MKSTVKERLEFFLKSEKISNSEFGRRIGACASYVASIRKSISPDKIEGIAENWPDLNIEWLLTGEGEMLKSQSTKAPTTSTDQNNNNVLSDRQGNYTAHPKTEDVEVVEAEEVEIKETIILTPEIINKEGIDLKKELRDGTLNVEVKPTQDVIPTHEAKVYTENDEMSPHIDANDPVFVQWLQSKYDFFDERMYFVDLQNGGVVRWVVKEDEDHIRLISMKTEVVVPMAAVKSMAKVVAITKRPNTLPKERITLEEAIAQKDGQLNMMLAHHGRIIEQQGELINIIKEQMKD